MRFDAFHALGKVKLATKFLLGQFRLFYLS